ncbi:hypothetical protein ANASTE_02014 [Anaerofustis stercorihominis DSM 17244]|uniref:Uncharacterized protein n=1 Tax=Anaerofustis stercorihominis DSM 17244 TaxID=445971 RepID=B1C9D9_9FIRM|nr:hypothetical protein [Anaerofustis stercorihominis]EDS72303.1 hypothetical protein ANASTE_02014 [Anaerofustis stercorihominis DSM 17244]
MKFFYVFNYDIYKKDFVLTKKELFINKLYKLFFGYSKMIDPSDIKDNSFKLIGKSLFVSNDEIIKGRNLDRINKLIEEEDIKFLCLESDVDSEIFKDISLMILNGMELRFKVLFEKAKKIIEYPDKTQIGLMIDGKSNYEYIKMICEYFPLVIFFVNNPYLGDNISGNILNDIGSSIYVSKDINSSKSCELIFDLSSETFSDKINIIKTDNYISLYKNKEIVEAKRKINNVKVRCPNIIIERSNVKNLELSFVEALMYEDKVVKSKNDIINVDMDKYLYEKCFKMIFFNEE